MVPVCKKSDRQRYQNITPGRVGCLCATRQCCRAYRKLHSYIYSSIFSVLSCILGWVVSLNMSPVEKRCLALLSNFFRRLTSTNYSNRKSSLIYFLSWEVRAHFECCQELSLLCISPSVILHSSISRRKSAVLQTLGPILKSFKMQIVLTMFEKIFLNYMAQWVKGICVLQYLMH